MTGPERLRENRNARYRERHPERIIEMRRKWREENRQHLRDMVKRQRFWYQQWIDLLKHTQGCLDCGRHDGCLDYHHVDPSSREVGMNHMRTFSLERWFDEVSKCVVLCRSCHMKRHHQLRSQA